ncbi:MAG: serine hydrolase domain-containing protein, partial [Candidatus Kariarchaeaceae archaeon]
MDTWEMTEEVYSTHIEPMIQRLVDKGLLPGVSLGFVTGGEVLFTRHYGFTNLENKTPPNDSSIYGIGSLAKSFTALTLLRMQEEGLVHVDDPIDMFFPFHLEDREIAIRHLLSHSSGIPNIGSALLVLSQDKSPFLPDLPEISIPFRSIEDYFAHLEHVKDYILFNLGEKFYYFNGGYTFLGEIISKVSGISYPQAFRKFVAEPMGLVDTVATLDEADHVRVVQAYGMKPGPDGVEALTGQHLNHPLAQAGGGILSTTTDMLRYVNHLLVSDFIPRNLREEMMRIHAKADTNESPEVFGLKGKHGYGYGWGINENFGGYVMVSHG